MPNSVAVRCWAAQTPAYVTANPTTSVNSADKNGNDLFDPVHASRQAIQHEYLPKYNSDEIKRMMEMRSTSVQFSVFPALPVPYPEPRGQF